MTVPSVPGVINSGDPITSAWLQATRSLVEFLRDNTPKFQGASATLVDTPNGGAGTELEFSDGDEGFLTPPTFNVGWTAGTDGDLGIVVPEDGYYQCSGWARFDANDNGGIRRVTLTDNTVGVSQSQVTVPGWSSPSVDTEIATASLIRYFTAGDVLGLSVVQTSGVADMDVVGALSAVWIGSDT